MKFLKKKRNISCIFSLILAISLCLPIEVLASDSNLEMIEMRNNVTPQSPLVYENVFLNNGKIDSMPYNGNKVSISSLVTDENGNVVSGAYVKVKFYEASTDSLIALMDVNANGKVQSMSSNIVSGKSYYFTYESNLKNPDKKFRIRVVSVVY